MPARRKSVSYHIRSGRRARERKSPLGLLKHAQNDSGEKCKRRDRRQHVQSELELHAILLLFKVAAMGSKPSAAALTPAEPVREAEGMDGFACCQAPNDAAARRFLALNQCVALQALDGEAVKHVQRGWHF